MRYFNQATPNPVTYRPTMPGYVEDAAAEFARMRTTQDQIHWLYRFVRQLREYVNDYPQLKDRVTELENLFKKFQESGFDDYYKKQIEAWISEHMPDILGEAITFVMPGITDDGHFCVWFPKRWRVVFDCVMNYASQNYGKLSIKY